MTPSDSVNSLRANISKTLSVVVINEQNEEQSARTPPLSKAISCSTLPRFGRPSSGTATFRLRCTSKRRMDYENTVLSLNPDGQTLCSQESALREIGFEVISVSTPIQARFEIEMGRCGIFLSSYITPLPIYRSLADLFRRSCPDGSVIFITHQPVDSGPEADVLLSQDEPQAIVRWIISKQARKAG